MMFDMFNTQREVKKKLKQSCSTSECRRKVDEEFIDERKSNQEKKEDLLCKIGLC